MADTSQSDQAPEPQVNGVLDGLDDDEKSKMRPADIDADMREMERRKRVEMIMNSRLFREELERIIDTQMKDGNGPSGLLQQLSEMMGVQGGRMQTGIRSSNCVVPINDIRGVESMGYAKGEKILRCKLAAVYRLMDLYGWTQGIHNHITARLNQDQELFLVNPYGMLYNEITASSLVKIDMQGAIVEQGTANFGVNVAGFLLHSAIHSARPDVKCVVHVHTPAVLAVSALKCGLLPTCEEAVVVGEVSHHQYQGGMFEPEERDKIARNLGPMNKVLFLANHGAVCCGETVEEAFYNVYNTVLACETQVKLMPMGVDNLLLVSDESRKQIYEAARRAPDCAAKNQDPDQVARKEKQWRIGGVDFEALMRMLDNAGFRTGYIYRHPLVKGEPPRPRNDVEVPPAVSSLGYLFEEEEMYKHGPWKKYMDGRKTHDRTRWLNSPNVYQKVEILETGTPDPKKITKWVESSAEEWVADGSPTHSSTPVKIDSALQFVPKNTHPREFKKLQQQIKDNRRADKITSGPQSHILEGVSWEEAKKLQDANITQTGDQVILVGAASKGIIQRGYQHNATMYKTPYAKNPFDTVTDDDLEEYKRVVDRKNKGESFDEDQSESEALSSSAQHSRRSHGLRSPLLSPTTASETEEESRDEPRVLRIETKHVPRPSQAEVVLSDAGSDFPEPNVERSKSLRHSSQASHVLDTTGDFFRSFSLGRGHRKSKGNYGLMQTCVEQKRIPHNLGVGSRREPNPMHFHIARSTSLNNVHRLHNANIRTLLRPANSRLCNPEQVVIREIPRYMTELKTIFQNSHRPSTVPEEDDSNSVEPSNSDCPNLRVVSKSSINKLNSTACNDIKQRSYLSIDQLNQVTISSGQSSRPISLASSGIGESISTDRESKAGSNVSCEDLSPEWIETDFATQLDIPRLIKEFEDQIGAMEYSPLMSAATAKSQHELKTSLAGVTPGRDLATKILGNGELLHSSDQEENVFDKSESSRVTTSESLSNAPRFTALAVVDFDINSVELADQPMKLKVDSRAVENSQSNTATPDPEVGGSETEDFGSTIATQYRKIGASELEDLGSCIATQDSDNLASKLEALGSYIASQNRDVGASELEGLGSRNATQDPVDDDSECEDLGSCIATQVPDVDASKLEDQGSCISMQVPDSASELEDLESCIATQDPDVGATQLEDLGSIIATPDPGDGVFELEDPEIRIATHAPGVTVSFELEDPEIRIATQDPGVKVSEFEDLGNRITTQLRGVIISDFENLGSLIFTEVPGIVAYEFEDLGTMIATQDPGDGASELDNFGTEDNTEFVDFLVDDSLANMVGGDGDFKLYDVDTDTGEHVELIDSPGDANMHKKACDSECINLIECEADGNVALIASQEVNENDMTLYEHNAKGTNDLKGSQRADDCELVLADMEGKMQDKEGFRLNEQETGEYSEFIESQDVGDKMKLNDAEIGGNILFAEPRQAIGLDDMSTLSGIQVLMEQEPGECILLVETHPVDDLEDIAPIVRHDVLNDDDLTLAYRTAEENTEFLETLTVDVGDDFKSSEKETNENIEFTELQVEDAKQVTEENTEFIEEQNLDGHGLKLNNDLPLSADIVEDPVHPNKRPLSPLPHDSGLHDIDWDATNEFCYDGFSMNEETCKEDVEFALKLVENPSLPPCDSAMYDLSSNVKDTEIDCAMKLSNQVIGSAECDEDTLESVSPLPYDGAFDNALRNSGDTESGCLAIDDEIEFFQVTEEELYPMYGCDENALTNNIAEDNDAYAVKLIQDVVEEGIESVAGMSPVVNISALPVDFVLDGDSTNDDDAGIEVDAVKLIHDRFKLNDGIVTNVNVINNFMEVLSDGTTGNIQELEPCSFPPFPEDSAVESVTANEAETVIEVDAVRLLEDLIVEETGNVQELETFDDILALTEDRATERIIANKVETTLIVEGIKWSQEIIIEETECVREMELYKNDDNMLSCDWENSSSEETEFGDNMFVSDWESSSSEEIGLGEEGKQTLITYSDYIDWNISSNVLDWLFEVDAADSDEDAAKPKPPKLSLDIDGGSSDAGTWSDVGSSSTGPSLSFDEMTNATSNCGLEDPVRLLASPTLTPACVHILRTPIADNYSFHIRDEADGSLSSTNLSDLDSMMSYAEYAPQCNSTPQAIDSDVSPLGSDVSPLGDCIAEVGDGFDVKATSLPSALRVRDLLALCCTEDVPGDERLLEESDGSLTRLQSEADDLLLPLSEPVHILVPSVDQEIELQIKQTGTPSITSEAFCPLIVTRTSDLLCKVQSTTAKIYEAELSCEAKDVLAETDKTEVENEVNDVLQPMSEPACLVIPPYDHVAEVKSEAMDTPGKSCTAEVERDKMVPTATVSEPVHPSDETRADSSVLKLEGGPTDTLSIFTSETEWTFCESCASPAGSNVKANNAPSMTSDTSFSEPGPRSKSISPFCSCESEFQSAKDELSTSVNTLDEFYKSLDSDSSCSDKEGTDATSSTSDMTDSDFKVVTGKPALTVSTDHDVASSITNRRNRSDKGGVKSEKDEPSESASTTLDQPCAASDSDSSCSDEEGTDATSATSDMSDSVPEAGDTDGSDVGENSILALLFRSESAVLSE